MLLTKNWQLVQWRQSLRFGQFLVYSWVKIHWNSSICALNPSHAAIKISIKATAAGFICKNIFPTPVQVNKIIKNKIGDIQQIYFILYLLQLFTCDSPPTFSPSLSIVWAPKFGHCPPIQYYLCPETTNLLRDFSDPFGNGSGTCPFGKNSNILLQIGNFHRLVRS